MGRKFLIIDDSALMRRVISDIIKQISDYEVLDLAYNGLEGFDRLVSKPGYYDLVILDINMPRMNGLEVLENLRKNSMNETVVVVSTVVKEGAVETIKALELGAVDFLTKPENFYEVKSDTFSSQLLSLIEVVTGNDIKKKNLVKPVETTVRNTTKTSISKPEIKETFKGVNRDSSKGDCIVALACSTGGPKSLQYVINKLPKNLAAPVVLVQHMPKGFTASLAKRLDTISEVTVTEAVDGDVLENGHVYIAPGGMHIRVKYENGKHVIRYDNSPAVGGLKPYANIMYESLIDTNYKDYVCVVLTGMGADGTEGITSLRKSGKKTYVISQDEESCVVYGMPRSIYEAGQTDEVQPLEKIAESVTKNVGVM